MGVSATMEWHGTLDAMTTIRTAAAAIPLLLASLIASACASAPHSTSTRHAASSADRAVLALLDEDLDAQAEANPVSASMRGDRRFDDQLPDVSPAAIEKRLAATQARLNRLLSIDREALSPEQRLNAELLEWELRDTLDAAAFKPWQAPITQQNGPHISAPQWADSLSFTQREHYEDYLARLRAFPNYIDQTIANMRAGLANGQTPPRFVLRAVPDQAAAQATPAHRADPASHPMYKPFRDLEPGDPLARSAREAILVDVLPAFEKLAAFLRDEYVPGARESIAAVDLPDGEASYANRLRHFTTTDLTAREIHEIGLREVARIRREMMDTIARSDFPMKESLEGDDLFRAFIDYLRTNPRFYYDDPRDLLRGYRDISKRIDGAMPELFGKLPRLSYGVREMPAFIAASAPTAYYYPGSLKLGVAGNFVANTTKLDQRPKYEMTALTLHEAVPGHHHQIALAQELEADGLHEWRTILGYTVFVEGWALYSERLGLEVGGEPGSRGMYEDPYDDFGRLSYEMWRALRLVVDPGMHVLGWSRQRAIDYMLENSALAEANVISEVDRYIAWPGQATGYKIGEIRIRELRTRAELILADRFDLRAFHDAILEAGAVPLSVLERRIDAWIASQAD